MDAVLSYIRGPLKALESQEIRQISAPSRMLRPVGAYGMFRAFARGPVRPLLHMALP